MNTISEFYNDLKHAKFQCSICQSVFHAAWFTKDWWKFLLGNPISIRNFICRMRGHAGVVFYNCSGYEPDMTCKFCHDDLG